MEEHRYVVTVGTRQYFVRSGSTHGARQRLLDKVWPANPETSLRPAGAPKPDEMPCRKATGRDLDNLQLAVGTDRQKDAIR